MNAPQTAQHLRSRILYFGDYATQCYGTIAFGEAGEIIASYDNAREHFYRFDATTLEFLYRDGASVTARFEPVQEIPLLYHGSTVGSANRLYLREALAFEPRDPLVPVDLSRPTTIVNTVSKSGTYWLQQALINLGFQPTDLHLMNAEVHDNRALLRDASIHRSPWQRRVPVSLAVLRSLLPRGSVSVGHIDDVAVLRDLIRRGCLLLLVVRDLRSILWSLYRFKLSAVDPVDDDDRHWRARESELERFLGFLTYHLDHDLIHIANCFRSFARLTELPAFRYEDLMKGTISQPGEAYLDQHLRHCGGAEAFRTSLAAAYRQPTPTLSEALPDGPLPEVAQQAEIRRLIDAVVVGSRLAEVNALFGYR
jgi:hypothetical protein